MKGLVAAVRTRAFCPSVTEALGAKMSSSGLSGVGAGPGLWIKEQEGGRKGGASG